MKHWLELITWLGRGPTKTTTEIEHRLGYGEQKWGKLDFAIQDKPDPRRPRKWALECDAEGNFLVYGQKLSPGQRVEVREVVDLSPPVYGPDLSEADEFFGPPVARNPSDSDCAGER